MTETAAPPEMLSIAEAAALLRIHRDTAYRWAKAGTFPVPVVRMGSVLRVRRQQLEEFISPPDPKEG
jgi:excisionase family DNA binding protein